jgi:cation transport regulator ChaC
MAARKIQVFLYGSAINLDVLSKTGLKKRAFAPAMLAGFDLIIQPVANLAENGDGTVYGILANFTHEEIEALVGNHTQSLTEATYHPEPVIVRTRGGKIVPAITYISTDLKPGFADSDYIDRIIKPAKNYGFPVWYLDRIEAFRGDGE